VGKDNLVPPELSAYEHPDPCSGREDCILQHHGQKLLSHWFRRRENDAYQKRQEGTRSPLLDAAPNNKGTYYWAVT